MSETKKITVGLVLVPEPAIPVLAMRAVSHSSWFRALDCENTDFRRSVSHNCARWFSAVSLLRFRVAPALPVQVSGVIGAPALAKPVPPNSKT